MSTESEGHSRGQCACFTHRRSQLWFQWCHRGEGIAVDLVGLQVIGTHLGTVAPSAPYHN